MPPSLVRQIAHVCIFTRDLKATEDFWSGVLGLPVAFRFERNGAPHGFYLAAGATTYIEVFERPASTYADTNNINHICLEVHSLDDAIAAIRARGVAVTDKKVGVDDTWQAWTTDPNGVKIELSSTPAAARFVGGDRVANW